MPGIFIGKNGSAMYNITTIVVLFYHMVVTTLSGYSKNLLEAKPVTAVYKGGSFLVKIKCFSIAIYNFTSL